MSQIPRRTTTLSMTQPPKAKRTPTMSPFPSSQQSVRQESATPRTTSNKTIDLGTPILIADTDFGSNILDNNELMQVLSSVEEKATSTPVPTAVITATANNGKSGEKKSEIPKLNDHSPSTKNRDQPASSAKRSKNKKPTASSPFVDDSTTGDDNSSSVVSVRSSVDTDTTAPEEHQLEMESLLLPEDEDDIVLSALKSSAVEQMNSTPSPYDSPRPNKTPGGSKIVRLSKGLRVSPFRKVEQLDNISTIVNLSTVSEQSVEANLDSSSPPAVVINGDGEGDNSTGSTNGTGEAAPVSSRRISARKTYNTNRPLRELSFRNATRDAYKKNGGTEENSNEAGTVNDSVNVTVGSELGCNMDDLPETPVVTAGQKRRRNEDGENSDHEDDVLPPEPKRSLFQTYCAIM